jgi:hypothetical protein
MSSEAPWTEEQVESLKGFQACEFFHPFTCNDAWCRAVLTPTTDGWVCFAPACAMYGRMQQNWCHEYMTNFLWEEEAGNVAAILNWTPLKE